MTREEVEKEIWRLDFHNDLKEYSLTFEDGKIVFVRNYPGFKEIVSTIFTDKDKQLIDLYCQLNNSRASGRTSRLVNHYIEEMFEKPMGTSIEIHDHYGFFDNMGHLNASKILLCKIKERLRNEYPNVEYEAKIQNGTCFLTRTSPTFREQWQEQYEKEITRKLEELNNNEKERH